MAEDKHDRLQPQQRLLLTVMRDYGVYYPSDMHVSKTCRALAERSFVDEQEDGGYKITAAGLARLEVRIGPPFKIEGPLAEVVARAGGHSSFIQRVGCNPAAPLKWSRGVKPSGPARNTIRSIAKESGLPDPFDADGYIKQAKG